MTGPEVPVAKSPNNVICPGWGGCDPKQSNPYNHYNPDIPAGQISHGLCPECDAAMKKSMDALMNSKKSPPLKEIYHELAMIGEDFMGSGAVDSQLPVMSARHTMTQLPGQEDRDDLMKPYHFTKDNSMKISDLIRKLYRRINNKNATPKTRLPLGY
jgi:hypothetical protein